MPAPKALHVARFSLPQACCDSGTQLGLRRQDTLDPALEFGAWEHDLTLATKAANADVRADAQDTPGITTTWVSFTHLDRIADGQRQWRCHVYVVHVLLREDFA